MSTENHKIDAKDRTINEVLSDKKYTVDYFQREYSWQKKHIEQLVTDLTDTFLNQYQSSDKRADVEGYSKYYLGPFVVCSKGGSLSIIDGQQRLTSITLLLIFLNHKQPGLLEKLIFSEKFGNKSFNIQVPEREECLNQLYITGEYIPKSGDDESIKNMAERYDDIGDAFPDEIDSVALPYFIDWLRENVILVEITAYSDDNAYTIFETMNDRGMSLTSTEMLKGFVLSRFNKADKRDKANTFWKNEIQKLHQFDKDEDLQFFQAWLRSQYAKTIRQGKAGSSNEDFEKIGTRFHSWFKDNLKSIGIKENSEEDFDRLVHINFKYFIEAYIAILDATKVITDGLEHVFYHSRWGIAESLGMPLMLAPLLPSDSAEITKRKINAVAYYLESFAVRRSINFRNFSASSIRYTMNSLVKEIRGKDIESLEALLKEKIEKLEENWNGVSDFRMHGMNYRFVKFLLARITSFIEEKSGINTNFATYHEKRKNAKPFEVEHIWANKFEEHRDEFDQENEFTNYRNRIGDLALLHNGTNQSFNDMPYEEKLTHYVKENLLLKSLHDQCYVNNPNFKSMINDVNLPFKAHSSFKKADINERQKLIQAICQKIWM